MSCEHEWIAIYGIGSTPLGWDCKHCNMKKEDYEAEVNKSRGNDFGEYVDEEFDFDGYPVDSNGNRTVNFTPNIISAIQKYRMEFWTTTTYVPTEITLSTDNFNEVKNISSYSEISGALSFTYLGMTVFGNGNLKNNKLIINSGNKAIEYTIEDGD